MSYKSNRAPSSSHRHSTSSSHKQTIPPPGHQYYDLFIRMQEKTYSLKGDLQDAESRIQELNLVIQSLRKELRSPNGPPRGPPPRPNDRRPPPARNNQRPSYAPKSQPSPSPSRSTPTKSSDSSSYSPSKWSPPPVSPESSNDLEPPSVEELDRKRTPVPPSPPFTGIPSLNGKTKEDYQRFTEGRCNACGSLDHQRKDEDHKKNLCGHCHKRGHTSIVCMRKFFGHPKKKPAPKPKPKPTPSSNPTPGPELNNGWEKVAMWLLQNAVQPAFPAPIVAPTPQFPVQNANFFSATSRTPSPALSSLHSAFSNTGGLPTGFVGTPNLEGKMVYPVYPGVRGRAEPKA